MPLPKVGKVRIAAHDMSVWRRYWASPDVGLFVHRAIRGHDVRQGPPKAPPPPAATPQGSANPTSPPAQSPQEDSRRRQDRLVGRPSIP